MGFFPNLFQNPQTYFKGKKWAKRQENSRYDQHRNRLLKVRPVVDTDPPRAYRILTKRLLYKRRKMGIDTHGIRTDIGPPALRFQDTESLKDWKACRQRQPSPAAALEPSAAQLKRLISAEELTHSLAELERSASRALGQPPPTAAVTEERPELSSSQLVEQVHELERSLTELAPPAALPPLQPWVAVRRADRTAGGAVAAAGQTPGRANSVAAAGGGGAPALGLTRPTGQAAGDFWVTTSQPQESPVTYASRQTAPYITINNQKIPVLISQYSVQAHQKVHHTMAPQVQEISASEPRNRTPSGRSKSEHTIQRSADSRSTSRRAAKLTFAVSGSGSGVAVGPDQPPVRPLRSQRSGGRGPPGPPDSRAITTTIRPPARPGSGRKTAARRRLQRLRGKVKEPPGHLSRGNASNIITTPGDSGGTSERRATQASCAMCVGDQQPQNRTERVRRVIHRVTAVISPDSSPPASPGRSQPSPRAAARRHRQLLTRIDALAAPRRRYTEQADNQVRQTRPNWRPPAAPLPGDQLYQRAMRGASCRSCNIVRTPSPISSNPFAFMDIEADGRPLGRLTILLRADLAPRTVENFRSLCTGEYGFGYKGTLFHRVIPRFVCQGGDVTFGGRNKQAPLSIYDRLFEDESFDMHHSEPGVVSMVNNGPNTNGTQFFICAAKITWLDGKNVAFGLVTEGLQVLRKIEALGTAQGVPLKRIVVHKCGQIIND
ncbi:Peptidyl-prolyl cis-trans isomerase F, mitochondrial [Amphibalanus amphitrite]|uniref:peptidylprolyl isomerase n=1 Tax=Amphibalanus amphitrite TaxID=1232801 RepID=A0A6A4VZF1_AMPAM|nr:Peptidyl-prolyl cis-trans isomerase F, mitochondrial [Amphibalanus amphitrite]